MSRLRRTGAALAVAAITAGRGLTARATAAAPVPGSGDKVTGRVDGHTYVLLGPSVFGVTVQQDPLAYHASKLADGTVRGHWTYQYYEAGALTSFSRPVTCLTVPGHPAWIGGPVARSREPAPSRRGGWGGGGGDRRRPPPPLPRSTTL